MLVSTDDGLFGFIVTRLSGRGAYRFQMIVSGKVIGDEGTCFLGTAMHELANLNTLEDERVAAAANDPEAVFSLIGHDDTLHDQGILSLAESLDQWQVQGYLHQGMVSVMAREYRDGESGPVLASLVPQKAYEEIVEAIQHHWLRTRDF